MPETSRSRKDNEHLTANSVHGLFSRKSMTGFSSPKMTGRMLRDRTDQKQKRRTSSRDIITGYAVINVSL